MLYILHSVLLSYILNMSDPVIVSDRDDSTNGVIIAIIVAAVIGLVIRAFASWRMNQAMDDQKTVDVNIEAPAVDTTDMPAVDTTDMWTVDAPAVDTTDMPQAN